MKKITTLLYLLLGLTAAHATVTLQYNSDGLQDSAGNPVANGSLVLLIANVNGSGFSNFTSSGTTEVGDFFNGGLYQILGRTFIDSFEDPPAGEFFAATDPLALQSTLFPQLTTGDQLAVVWFPTLTNYSSAYLPGTSYGLYTLLGNSDWTVPADSVTSSFPATVPTGLRSLLVVSAIPEPSTYAAIFGGLVLGLAAYRKRKTNRA